MSRKVLSRLLVSAVAAAAAFTAVAANRFEWIQTPKHLFMVLPPTFITDNAVQLADWSPDGAYLLLNANPRPIATLGALLGTSKAIAPQSGTELLVWDREHANPRKLWSSDDPTLKVLATTWLRGSSTALITVGALETVDGKAVGRYGVLALNAQSGQTNWVPDMGHLTSPPAIFPSPLQPTAAVVLDSQFPDQSYLYSFGRGRTARVLNSYAGDVPLVSSGDVRLGTEIRTIGVNGQAVKSPIDTSKVRAWVGDLVWSKDGSRWLLATGSSPTNGETAEATKTRLTTKAVLKQFMPNGDLASVNAELYWPSLEQPELAMNANPMVAKLRKVKRGIKNIWISSPEPTPHPDMLITPDGQQAKFAPSQNAVFYVEGGIAKVRCLEALNDDQKRAFYKAVRTEALSNAKQVALALIMSAGDNDDNLPSADKFDSISQYTKNSDIMDGFNYTPPANLSESSIESPAETSMGYIDVPGGRVVAYTDGHCKFIPDP